MSHMIRMIRTDPARKPRTWAAATVLSAAAVIAGTAGCSPGDQAPDKPKDAVRSAAARPPAASASPDRGDLVTTYAKGAAGQDRETEAFLRQNKVLEDVATYADSYFALPHDVPLRAKSCGDANAFWNPETKDITYCYEFAAALRPVYEQQETEGDARQRAAAVDEDVIGLTNGVLFHELGHGLVALYDLPITGREEDAVDQLSVLMLATGDEKHAEYAVSTINAWAGLAQADAESKQPLDDYADEHSLSAQRYFNWACWLYGSDPEAYKSLVETTDNPDGVLPQSRAEQCPAEFSKISNAWGTLLDPYMKE
ncbi:DUF4344 domain-containing metallopeptidase [Streptomyces sp. NPDC058486]|uniref:DUF4344 domain-containing metallopeptidase n=1 Tax=unclassified Streptomyces TaxID=2593676 RepID=UPI00365402B2